MPPGELMAWREPVVIRGAEGIEEAVGEVDEPHDEEEGEGGVPTKWGAFLCGNQKRPTERDERGDESEKRGDTP